MPLARPRQSARRMLHLFCLVSLTYPFGGISGMGDTPVPPNFDPVMPGGRTTDSGNKNFTPTELPALLGTRDLFHETKPEFVPPEQWAEWKRRYGFAPLGDFCDNCRRVPGKCLYLQGCQDFCADDCYGHGKELTIDILCGWCNGARDQRCRDWRSCRKHCELLCLHERYRLKVEADLRKEEEESKKRRTLLYEEYLKKKREEEEVLVERHLTLRKKQLEETRKRLAKLAELEYRPVKDEL